MWGASTLLLSPLFSLAFLVSLTALLCDFTVLIFAFVVRPAMSSTFLTEDFLSYCAIVANENEETSVRWIVLATTSVQFIILLGIIFYAKRQISNAKRNAEEGQLTNENDTPLIFPSYVTLLWVCAACELVEGLLSVLKPYNMGGPNTLSTSLVNGVSYMLYGVVIEGLTILLMSRGTGVTTMRLVLCGTLLWALASFAFQTVHVYYASTEVGLVVELVWQGVMCIFYTLLVVLPRNCCFRRPALLRYAAFYALMHFLHLCATIIVRYNNVGFCLYEVSWGIFLIFHPWVLYRTLTADSKFWQGLRPLRSRRDSDDAYASITAPLSGVCLAPDTAREVAISIDTLYRMSVPLLNFALLRIDKSKEMRIGGMPVVLGAGSNSRVFQGAYNGRPVAIKMLFSPSLTPDVVTTFCEEAGMLGSLQHPNVVEILGICISPPSLCLVMELCSGGNLFDLIRVSSPTLIYDWPSQLRLATQCAKAVAFLHSQKPPVIHLDIKSPNFLLSKYHVLKIADLELSRRIENTESGTSKSSSSSSRNPNKPFIVPDTINWLAPEILKGDHYNESADVYSLACVLWEIVAGDVPYQDFIVDQNKKKEEERKRQREQKLAKKQDSEFGQYGSVKLKTAAVSSRSSTESAAAPLLSPRVSSISQSGRGGEAELSIIQHIIQETYRPPISEGVHPTMAAIIRSGWASDPKQRPTSKEICNTLESLRHTMEEDGKRLRDYARAQGY